ncbi:MAG: TolC family protein [Gammaproteobacteria bacterium]|nr:TolC family protein [Gammaproteobacteria bacterium]
MRFINDILRQPAMLAVPLAMALHLPAAAQAPGVPSEHGPAEHEPLDVDRGLEWDVLLDRAVLNYPRYVELAARDAEAQAWSRRSASPFAGRPSLVLGYRSDDPLDDYGFAEYESGISMPLWRFGQKRAAGQIGRSASDEAAAAESALRWEVAGALREALWDIEAALNDLELANEALTVAVEIERVVRRRQSVGDLPLEDALLAETTVLDRRTSVVERRAELVDAEFAYETLTGLGLRPAVFDEPLTSRRDFAPSHPLLSLADAELERTRAQLEFAERDAKGSPTLLIGPRRQRDPMATFYTDSVGVEVTVPFGGGSHTATTTAAAVRRVAEAEAERAAVERRLHAQLHEALHTLATAEEALELAEQRADVAAQHRRMGQTAFEQGEITLVDLLRRVDAAQVAERQAAALRVMRGRSIAAVNHAVGELP